MPVFLLLSDKIKFPPPQLASKHGILGRGGRLSKSVFCSPTVIRLFCLVTSDDEPLIWWGAARSASRAVPPGNQSSKTLEKISKNVFQVTMDLTFRDDIHHCADIRLQNEGTWIVDDIDRCILQAS